MYLLGVIAYEGIGGTIGGMLSGGGFEYMLILVTSAVVRRPWDLSPLLPPPAESGEASSICAICADFPLGRSLPIRALLRGGDDVTESAGEPPPEDPVGVRCAGGVTAGLTSEEGGGKAGPLVHQKASSSSACMGKLRRPQDILSE